MGFFDFARVCLYTEVDGIVTLNDKPVGGVEVIRSAWWPEKLHTDSTVTDTQGRFHFEPMHAVSLIRQYVPIEPIIGQQLLMRYQGKEILAWQGSKRGYDNETDFEDKRSRTLLCELTAELTMKGEKFELLLPVKTICRW